MAHGFILAINLALFFYVTPILKAIDQSGERDSRVKVFRSLNLLIIALQILDIALIGTSSQYQQYFIRVGASLLTIYASLFGFSLGSYFSRKKFGQKKLIDDKELYLDNYSSRLVEILLLCIIVLSAIYALIKLWGADSLLETTGIIGIFFAFLAFTSHIWAPDIISGLIILNSQMLEDGDLVVIDGWKDEYLINKVSFIYTIFYDIRNNHRTMIRNSRFIQSKIDNLSRIASTDGIRQALHYHIGYPQLQHITDKQERLNELASFESKVDRMFEKAYEQVCLRDEIKINRKRNFEWSLTQTGDYALQYTLWVYLERIPNTKVTATVRKHLIGSLYKINEAVFRSSIAEGLDLSTPDLVEISSRSTAAPRAAYAEESTTKVQLQKN